MKRNFQQGVAHPGGLKLSGNTPLPPCGHPLPIRWGEGKGEGIDRSVFAGRGLTAAAPSPRSQQGVALVITLILLSVITFMAVTFLVVSRRGSEQVNTTTQQANARFAADMAAEQAKSGILADMIARVNGFDFGLRVSTNYQSAYFIGSGPGVASITNVSYMYSNNVLITTNANDYQRMLANQMILPRPPVFIVTNKATGATDFRYFLNLNRNYDANGNAIFEPTGPGAFVDQFGVNNIGTLTGDPQWIGVLEHPDQRHSSSNRYIARYCFIAVPIGNSLDLNAIHNHAKYNLPATLDGFLRNEGVGSWEINLAGFLNGLNPRWGYLQYVTNTPPSGSYAPNLGNAFSDANSLLQYRYAGGSPATAVGFLGPNAAAAFAGDGIDDYTGGPLMTGFGLPPDGDNLLVNSTPWSGSDNPMHVFTTQDYYNYTSIPNNFSPTLLAASFNTNSTFDEYTYYRLLAQMGTDSAPEDTNKLNLNYINLGGISANNFIPWSALTNGKINGTPVTTMFPGATITDGSLAFFTNAVDRLLKAEAEFADLSVTNIPIYPTNRYTPAVHRLIQLAANIYDSTQNKATNAAPFNFDYPSVFRPTFGVNGTNIYISGYVAVGTNADYLTVPLFLPDQASLVSNTTVNIYGIPWVIGAKRGFPNFNQFSMQETFALSRKLQIIKPFLGADRSTWHTNIQYGLSLSNTVAVEAWNSYITNYTRPVSIIGVDDVSLFLTNAAGQLLTNITVALPITFATNNWQGFPTNQANRSAASNSFIVPLDFPVPFLPGAVFHPNGTFTITTNLLSVPFDTTAGYPQPLFNLNLTNRLRFIMLDALSGRVIDYVHFNGMTSQQDFLSEIEGPVSTDYGGVWITNRVDGSTNIAEEIEGIEYQIQASLVNPPFNNDPYPPITDVQWANANYQAAGFKTVNDAVSQFSSFYNPTGGNTNLVIQVPYSPTRTVSVYYTWQANDPLVHYTLPDLTGIGDFSTAPLTNYDSSISDLVTSGLRRVNKRYLPWSGAGNQQSDNYANYIYNLALMDPQITRSDDWQFPTNPLPNIGWLGRVHRGTPWQTVYMKSPTVDHGLWQNWTGNTLTNYPCSPGYNLGPVPGIEDDTVASRPINDRAIFDLFTTAPNDNATRGQLSVNQTNFAAWAALLDGLIVITNNPNATDQTGYGPWVIDPNTNAAALAQIVSDLNAQKTNYLGNVWVRLGDMLSTPSLTVNSPFVNTNVGDPGGFPNDMAIERIPQQIMSLVRVGSPRYVIYAYGQSLKPADRSLVTSGPFFGLCQNYQITGEVATRTVVRFEPSAPLNPLNPGTPFNPTRNPAIPGQLFQGSSPTVATNRQPNPRAVIESFTLLPPE